MNNKSGGKQILLNGIKCTKAWWKESVVYQIYPSTFKDSNNDGWGDLNGISMKLDYLKDLGVDMIWICPIFKSPQVDMGYDVSDYYVVDEKYGSNEDLSELINKAHSLGIKVLLDLVVNHSSNMHKWFIESKSSRSNPYLDWYIWRDPRYNESGERMPPNNWGAFFGGSAWTYDDKRDQYYLNLFTPQQPDLNWENEALRNQVYDIMRFWLDKGVDGFRLDVINFISKNTKFPDAPILNPKNKYQIYGPGNFSMGPRLDEYLSEIGRIVDEYDGFTVGEFDQVSNPEEVLNAIQYDRHELSTFFNWEHMSLDRDGANGALSKRPSQWKLTELKSIFNKWQKGMQENDGWNSLYLENHDNGRSISRFADDSDEYRDFSSKLLATLISFKCGTLFIYQGQEIGMRNYPKSWGIENYKDLETLNYWKEACTKGEEAKKIAFGEIQKKSRDHPRTPFPWKNESPYAGFSEVEPWKKVLPDYPKYNSDTEVKDPLSVFNYWKKILKLKKNYCDLFTYGLYEIVDFPNEEVYAYTRTFENEKALIVCSFSKEEIAWCCPIEVSKSTIILSNYEEYNASIISSPIIKLKPYAAIVLHWVSC